MTRDDIIRMAREADAAHDEVVVTPLLERFASLVAEAEREACAKVGHVPDIDALAQFIREVDGNHRMEAGALAEKICEWLETIAYAGSNLPLRSTPPVAEIQAQMVARHSAIAAVTKTQAKGSTHAQ